jgi:hypothetical protein
MNKLEEIRAQLRHIEQELAAELERIVEQNHERFRYTVRAGRVRFENGVRALHHSHRKGLIAYVRNAPISYVLTAPFTYGLFVPLLATDIAVNVFQQVCFRTYGIKIVRRRDYLVFDRQLLGYLNAIEKLNCVYCSYANGLISFIREVAARTEQYWCPIKHARHTLGEHNRMEEFFDYGDAESYHADLPRIRARLVD